MAASLNSLGLEISKHYEYNWKRDAYKTERESLVDRTHVVMIDRLTTLPDPNLGEIDTEIKYLETLRRIHKPQTTFRTLDAELAKFRQAVDSRIQTVEQSIADFVAKDQTEANKYLMPISTTDPIQVQALAAKTGDRPIFRGNAALIEVLENKAKELKNSALDLFVEGMDQCGTETEKQTLYLQNRIKVQSKIQQIESHIKRLKDSEVRLKHGSLTTLYNTAHTVKAVVVKMMKGQFTTGATELMQQQWQAHPVRTGAIGVAATAGLALFGGSIVTYGLLETLRSSLYLSGLFGAACVVYYNSLE